MNGKKFHKNIKVCSINDAPTILNHHIISNQISNSFEYSDQFKITDDFYPLFTKKVLHKSFFLFLNNNELIGTILLKEKKISSNDNTLDCACLGGIQIKKGHQGKGYFDFFFNKVLQKIKEQKTYDSIILWSDKEKLYSKFGFKPFGKIFWANSHRPLLEIPKGYLKTSLQNLTEKEFNEIKSLHLESYKNISFDRDFDEWDEIKNISSMELFIKKNIEGEIKSYFIRGKGMDLQGVIHEYAPLTEPLNTFSSYSHLSQRLSDDQCETLPAGLILYLNKEKSQGHFLENDIFFTGVDSI
ncbi:MAG: hypothetical protein CME61_02335 [Halobacteriovoraceae bacterium]|nr:hypothetical protein [Halobacteriovoraceae bacterium]